MVRSLALWLARRSNTGWIAVRVRTERGIARRCIAACRYNSRTMRLPSRRHFLETALVAPAGLATALHGAESDPFKLAVTTDEIDDDLRVAIPFLKRFGLRYCEIRRLWQKYNTSQPLAKIRAARGMLDDAGIRLAILDTGFFKIRLPASDSVEGAKVLQEQWDLLERAFERADILGTRLIRTFGFTYKRGTKPDPAAYPRIYDLVAESAERAEKNGFRLAVENVGNSFVATSAQCAELLRAVRSPALGLTWDPNNAAGEGDPEPFPAGYESLDAKRIWHVHFRDYRRNAEGDVEWCGVGDGEFDHVGQLRALQRDGYHGSVSLETHFKINGSKADASAYSLERLLKAVKKV